MLEGRQGLEEGNRDGRKIMKRWIIIWDRKVERMSVRVRQWEEQDERGKGKGEGWRDDDGAPGHGERTEWKGWRDSMQEWRRGGRSHCLVRHCRRKRG